MGTLLPVRAFVQPEEKVQNVRARWEATGALHASFWRTYQRFTSHRWEIATRGYLHQHDQSGPTAPTSTRQRAYSGLDSACPRENR